ncbi:DinB family protein [Pseudovibrio axinellae]
MRSLDQSGTKLRSLSESMSDDEFFAEDQTGMSVAWHYCHLLSLEDWTVNRVILEGKPKLPFEFRDAFRGGRPITDQDRGLFPTKLKLESDFSRTRESSLLVLSKFDDSNWNRSTPNDCRFATLGDVWENLANDSWWHIGYVAATVPRCVGSLQATMKPRFYSTDLDDINLSN